MKMPRGSEDRKMLLIFGFNSESESDDGGSNREYVH